MKNALYDAPQARNNENGRSLVAPNERRVSDIFRVWKAGLPLAEGGIPAFRLVMLGIAQNPLI